MSSWSLNASGQIPATMAADTSADPAAGPVAQNVMAVEAGLYEALKAVLDPFETAVLPLQDAKDALNMADS